MSLGMVRGKETRQLRTVELGPRTASIDGCFYARTKG